MRATRAQADRVLYKQAIRTSPGKPAQSHLVSAEACDDLLVETFGGEERVTGAVTQLGIRLQGQRSVVLTAGTFLSTA